ncbi:MAG TPA: ATP-binding protein [Syntrophorhabdaceae bacterium]|nr:ATP-binding protein [Syntrophorhabdaceae bacterium]HQM80255.1 ATP-binding protein [Syntrophorhabdaceae bacterium]
MNPETNIDQNALRSILNSIPIGVYIIDRNLSVRWTNRRMLRWTKEKQTSQAGDKHCYAIIFDGKSPCVGCPAIKSFESNRTEYGEVKKTGKKRGNAHYLITSTPSDRDADSESSYFIMTIQDITEYKMAEDELRRLNEFNKEIIENAPVAIFTVNKKGEFSSVNPALAVLSGLGEKAGEKLLGFNWLKNPYTIKCGLAQYIREALEGKPFQLWDFPFITYWGAPQYIYFKGVPVRGKEGNVEGLLCIIEDTTEIVRTRAQLIQEAKMSFVGRLAAGIAHELNNPLATITANAELAKELIENVSGAAMGESDLGELKEYIDTIEEQAYRCTRTIRNLLEVTRKKDLGTSNINFNDFISEVLDQINFRKIKVKLVKEIQPGLPEINGDPEALRQVFLNVISNAVDAVEGTENATVWIKTMLKSDNQLEVAVEDNGIGIPEDMAELIFEPFFTTKEPKKGTGLGLTLCYDFLQRMGGSIRVQQRPKGGSIFTIKLPVYDQKKTGYQSA